MSDTQTPDQQIQHLQQQLAAFQSAYRNALIALHSLDTQSAMQIASGNVKEMESMALQLKETKNRQKQSKTVTMADQYIKQTYLGPLGTGESK